VVTQILPISRADWGDNRWRSRYCFLRWNDDSTQLLNSTKFFTFVSWWFIKAWLSEKWKYLTNSVILATQAFSLSIINAFLTREWYNFLRFCLSNGSFHSQTKQGNKMSGLSLTFFIFMLPSKKKLWPDRSPCSLLIFNHGDISVWAGEGSKVYWCFSIITQDWNEMTNVPLSLSYSSSIIPTNNISSLCSDTGRFLRSILVALLEVNGCNNIVLIQPRGTSFVDYCYSQRLPLSGAGLYYEVGTIEHSGDVITDEVGPIQTW